MFGIGVGRNLAGPGVSIDGSEQRRRATSVK
jgi:hypothetical protein